MEESINLIDWIVKNWQVTSGGVIVTTLTLWALMAIKLAHKKFKNTPTKDDLERVKEECKEHTNVKLKVHEDKQILELSAVVDKVNHTHEMVHELWKSQLNK